MQGSALTVPLRTRAWDRSCDDLLSWRTCPVCYSRWRPSHGSFLRCHAKCLLTEETEDALLAEEGTTQKEQAERLGIVVGIVRDAVRRAQRRRNRRRAGR